MAMKSKTAIDPAQGVTDGLGHGEPQAVLHLILCHPSLLNHCRQGDLEISLRNFTQVVGTGWVQSIDQAEHPQEIELRHTLFMQRDNLTLAQADYQGFWPGMHKQRASFATECEHLQDRLETQGLEIPIHNAILRLHCSFIPSSSAKHPLSPRDGENSASPENYSLFFPSPPTAVLEVMLDHRITAPAHVQ
jgi:hypothetical protein